ncbi:MAG: phage holin family protein [Planctomycetota bacterium]
MPPQNDDLTLLVQHTVDDLGHLVAEHVHLAKLELVENLNAVTLRVARAAVVLGLALMGYFFLCAGVVVLLGPALGMASASFLVGSVHLAAGAIGLVLASGRLARTRVVTEVARVR